MAEFYAYNTAYYTDEEEEFLQEQYEEECAQNYPITWEADNTEQVKWEYTGRGVSICAPRIKPVKKAETTKAKAETTKAKAKTTIKLERANAARQPKAKID